MHSSDLPRNDRCCRLGIARTRGCVSRCASLRRNPYRFRTVGPACSWPSECCCSSVTRSRSLPGDGSSRSGSVHTRSRSWPRTPVPRSSESSSGAARRPSADRDRPALAQLPRRRALALPVARHARSDRQRRLGPIRAAAAFPGHAVGMRAGLAIVGGGRRCVGGAHRRATSTGREEVDPSLPGRTLAEAANRARSRTPLRSRRCCRSAGSFGQQR